MRKMFAAQLMALLCLSSSVGRADDITHDDPNERAAMIDFGNSLNSKEWIKNTHWNTDKSVCDWHGVNCTSGHVTSISLEHNGLRGSLPNTIGKLRKLKVLNLNGGRPPSYYGCGKNNLTMSGIPDGLYNLTELKSINLEYTCLAGPISARVGNLLEMESFSVHGNFLSGTIPTAFNQLVKMQTLKLGRNPLVGGFPELSSLRAMIQFNCNFCGLTGPVPDIFDSFPLLEESYWDGNGFTGSLPSSIGTLRNLKRVSFNINNFTGPLPDWSGATQLTDCRIGSDTNLTAYLADYPWIRKVDGNKYSCPISKKMAELCNHTDHCADVVNPCSPLECV